MPWWLDLLIALAGGVVLAWVALLVLLAVSRPRGAGAGELLAETSRLLPDVVRLVGRLAADRSLPRGVRVRLVALAAYLASPLDLIPDVIPVLGVLDDAILVAWLLRSVVRRAGPDALTRHWPGSPAGLAAIRRLAGLGRE